MIITIIMIMTTADKLMNFRNTKFKNKKSKNKKSKNMNFKNTNFKNSNFKNTNFNSVLYLSVMFLLKILRCCSLHESFTASVWGDLNPPMNQAE